MITSNTIIHGRLMNEMFRQIAYIFISNGHVKQFI